MKKNKAMILIALILMSAMGVSFVALPVAYAQLTDVPTTAYMNVSPDPIGVGQTGFVFVWLDRTFQGASVGNQYRFHNYTLTITKPDNTTETIVWETVLDTTSSAYVLYSPEMVGTYHLNFTYPGEIDRDVRNYLPSNRTMTWTVQEERIPDPLASYPLPEEYWTWPIDSQNTWWYQISSNWYNSVRDRNYGGNLNNRFQPDGVAPNSPHVMWTLPHGTTGFATQIIMHGRLYYPVPLGDDAMGGGWRVVDLRTGEEIMHVAAADLAGMPEFGYYMDWNMYNQHGVIPSGSIVSENFGTGLNALTLQLSGNGVRFTTIAGTVPSGVEVISPSGAHLRINLNDLTPVVSPTFVNSLMSETTSTSSNHVVTMPSGIQADDLLLWFLSSDGQRTVTFPDPWIEIGESSYPGQATFAVAYTKAFGNESDTTFTATTSGSELSMSIVWVVRGAADPDVIPPYISEGASGYNNAPDPPALSVPALGFYDAYLWIAAEGNDDDDLAIAFPYPDNQETYESVSGSGGSAIAVCSLTSSVNSQDPDAFTIEASEQWNAYTLAIAPPPRLTEPTPDYRLEYWNSSRMWSGDASISSTVNAGTASRFEYRISVIDNLGNPLNISAPGAVNVAAMITFDENTRNPKEGVLVCRIGTLPSPVFAGSYKYFGISLLNQTINGLEYLEGQLMWERDNYNLPEGTIIEGPAAEGVFTLVVKETGQWMGFDMLTGAKLWTSDPQTNYSPYGYTEQTSATGATVSIADGKLFTTGYSGMVFCYDLYNGTLLWRYEALVAGYAAYTHYPLHIGVITDNKIYLGTITTVGDPLLPGSMVRCLDVDSGNLVWAMSGWGGANSFAVADGYLVFHNLYDGKIYCVGKGPSATTVRASPEVSVLGTQVTVTGTVTDVSLGSAIKGSAAISDADMGAWAAHKLMGHLLSANVTGVEVVVKVLDPNNNSYEVGRTLSDANGEFSCVFEPEVAGTYTIIASFVGSGSYWPSFANTIIGVEEAPPVPEPTPQPESMTDMYVLGSAIGIVAALLVAAAVIMLTLRRSGGSSSRREVRA